MAAASQKGEWSGSGRLRGGRWGPWFFITALRYAGLRVTHALAVPVALVFSFVSPDVPATMDFHYRVFGPMSRLKRRWLVFRHFLSFGHAIIDRIAILNGDRRNFTFAFDGETHLRQALAEGKGVLLLTAHLGNWEAAGALLSRLNVPVNVTGFDHENSAVRTLLNKNSQAGFRLMPLTGSPTDTIPLVAALRRGEIVAMMGDRPYGSPAVDISFLGGAAAFPIGAYVMAAIAKAPLLHVFSLSEPRGHYHFFGFPAQYPQMPPHSQRDAYLRECAGKFAADLTSVLRRDPLQWYNFAPFWHAPAAPARRRRHFSLCLTA